MAVEAMELIYNESIDALALVTRDADFKAVLKKAMEMGKETIIIGAEPGFSAALKNSADIAIVLNQEDFEEVDEGLGVSDVEVVRLNPDQVASNLNPELSAVETSPRNKPGSKGSKDSRG
jgi:hypothetical protein